MTIQHNGNNLAVVESAPAPLAPRPAAAEPANDSIIEIIWRQRNVVALAVGVCLLLAVLYLLVATRYYSGYARLYVQQGGPRILAADNPDRQSSDAFLFTQREVLSSTPVVAMTLGTPGIRDLKTFSGEDNTFTFFKKNLSIEVGKKDELLSVQFDTPYRDEAQKIIAAFVDAYVEYQSKQRHSSSSEVISVLQQEKEKRQAELLRKQDELQAYRQANGMLSGIADDKSNVVRQRLDSLSAELTRAQLETISAKSAWDDVNRVLLIDPAHKAQFEQFRSNSAGYSAPSSTNDADLRSQMLQWQAHLQMLQERYLPNHPSVRNAQARIDQLNIQYAAAVYRRWETARAHEGDLQASFEQQRTLAIQQNARAVEDTRLASDVTRLQKNVEDLDERAKQVMLTQGGEGTPNIQVIEPPSASKAPTRPYTGRTLALSLLAGIVFGCCAACIRDWYDFRLRSADEIKTSLGVTVLGLIPKVEDETSPIARGQKVHIDPGSEVAEAYRSLRTAIYFGTKDKPARTILVTSPERGDGKTTLASNLAICMAQASRRTLLLDADLRAPMQDLIFSMNGRVGLANVLSGKDVVENAIRHTGIENLDILPAGVAARNPSELLNHQNFIDLLESLAEKYDHVIIDSPPLLAVTDARIIAASAEATVLVLRAGKSNRKLGELSIDGLLSVGANLLGAVVNDVQRRGYKYGGAYGRYGYGANDRSTDRDAVIAGTNGNGRSEYASDDSDGSLASRGRLTG